MPFSLFVYYNKTVHISKTTRVTTSVQENFFLCSKKQLNGAKTKLLSQGRFFAKVTWSWRVRPRADQTVGSMKILIRIDAQYPNQDFGEEKSLIFQVTLEIFKICQVGLHFIFHWIEVACPVSSSSPCDSMHERMRKEVISIYYSRIMIYLHNNINFIRNPSL